MQGNTLHEPPRNVLSLNRPRRQELAGASGDSQQRRPLDPRNGHEAILKTMIKNRQDIAITFRNGEQVYGRISQFDNFTITIYPDDNDGMPETFFKHDIRSFTASTSRVKE